MPKIPIFTSESLQGQFGSTANNSTFSNYS